MTIRNYTNPATGFTTTGLVERAQADGLVPVGLIYPNTPVAKPNTYDCGGAGEKSRTPRLHDRSAKQLRPLGDLRG